VMTSSSSPGVSLKQEGISYLVGAELPCLVCNVQRAGPGLGTIQPSQSDYFQATKGGGHGDYHTIVLSPSTVQEIVDLVRLGFDLADKYNNPSMLLADGMLGQLMEPVDFGDYKPEIPEKPWALNGCRGRNSNMITSIYIQPEIMEKHNARLQEKFTRIREAEQRWEEWSYSGETELLVVAHGTMARIAKSAIREARKNGVKAGLIRPISLWPFPVKAFVDLHKVNTAFVVEMSSGQMLEDVMLAITGRVPVHFFGRMGGMVPTVEQIYERIMELHKTPVKK
jgi:2-oxoglutarate/2-oxoacid ferredoxin oxidoreductase subunit alpha